MPEALTNDIAVLTTGGTIDKVYFDAKSTFEIGHSVVEELLRQAHVDGGYVVREVMRKDSLEMTDDDRNLIAQAAADAKEQYVVVTHGTDTMTCTAKCMQGMQWGEQLADKTIVLTGALSPARFAKSDATFNVGMAFAAVQSLPCGVYIVMNGQVFVAGEVQKDTENNVFQRC